MKEKLKNLKTLLTHLEEQEDALIKEGKEDFLPNHTENCKQLIKLSSESYDG